MMNEREKTQAVDVLRLLLNALIETINECPHGAPCGPMYAALLTQWPALTASQFNQLLDVCCATGKVRRSGHVMYPVLIKK